MENVAAIILAAGKGTRMKSTNRNKVSLNVNGEPMLVRTLNILNEAGIEDIIVVVGFAKKSVQDLLHDKIIVVEQTKRLGTGHAVKSAISKIPDHSDCVLILYGDDAFMHSAQTYKELYKIHKSEKARITFITMDNDNPTSYGRILRDSNQNVVGIVEEKNADENQKKIKEINLGCYLIDKKYLIKNLNKIKKNELTGEYYITDIIDIISKQNGKIAVLKSKSQNWRGVNTLDDLQEVEKMLKLN